MMMIDGGTGKRLTGGKDSVLCGLAGGLLMRPKHM